MPKTGHGRIHQQGRHQPVERPVVFAQETAKDVPAQGPAGGGQEGDHRQQRRKQADGQRVLGHLHDKGRIDSHAVQNAFQVKKLQDETGLE